MEPLVLVDVFLFLVMAITPNAVIRTTAIKVHTATTGTATKRSTRKKNFTRDIDSLILTWNITFEIGYRRCDRVNIN